MTTDAEGPRVPPRPPDLPIARPPEHRRLIRVAVLGAGSWGTTVASLAAHNAPTTLWSRRSDTAAEINADHRNSRYLEGFELHEALAATDELADAVRTADVLVMGVPSQHFRDVLEQITLNAAMGVFLNTLGNQKADPATGRVPDENFGREIMQLFSIGLFELNIDGTERLDGSGNPIETYDNDDVTGIAKVFTGYNYSYENGITFESPADRPNLNIPEARLLRNPMTANNAFQLPNRGDQHSLEEKSFLGVTIPQGTGAAESLRIAMDTLFEHPNVGPFFGKQMIQRLVTSNPSPAYVQRVAEVFNNNGRGERGDERVDGVLDVAEVDLRPALDALQESVPIGHHEVPGVPELGVILHALDRG